MGRKKKTKSSNNIDRSNSDDNKNREDTIERENSKKEVQFDSTKNEKVKAIDEDSKNKLKIRKTTSMPEIVVEVQYKNLHLIPINELNKELEKSNTLKLSGSQNGNSKKRKRNKKKSICPRFPDCCLMLQILGIGIKNPSYLFHNT